MIHLENKYFEMTPQFQMATWILYGEALDDVTLGQHRVSQHMFVDAEDVDMECKNQHEWPKIWNGSTQLAPAPKVLSH